jgi:uncharacterized membrane protein
MFERLPDHVLLPEAIFQITAHILLSKAQFW